MRGGKEALESVLGRPVDVFAYPWGTATDETAAACRAAGFVAACTSASSGSWDDPFRLPREPVGNRDTALGPLAQAARPPRAADAPRAAAAADEGGRVLVSDVRKLRELGSR